MTETAKYADMFNALGSEQRLEIVRLLIGAGTVGLTVGEIQGKLSIPNSTLSHHLEKLRQEELVVMRKDKQWIWHSVNLESVGKLISFLCDQCYRPEKVQAFLSQVKKDCQKTRRREDGLRETN